MVSIVIPDKEPTWPQEMLIKLEIWSLLSECGSSIDVVTLSKVVNRGYAYRIKVVAINKYDIDTVGLEDRKDLLLYVAFPRIPSNFLYIGIEDIEFYDILSQHTATSWLRDIDGYQGLDERFAQH